MLLCRRCLLLHRGVSCSQHFTPCHYNAPYQYFTAYLQRLQELFARFRVFGAVFFYVVLPYGNVAPHEILLVKTENILFQNFFTSWLRQVPDKQFRGALLLTHKLTSELAPQNTDYEKREGIHHERDHQDQQDGGIP